MVLELEGFVYGGAEGGGVGAADGVDGFAAVEDDEGGHGADAVGAGDGGVAVDVDLAEGNFLGDGVFLGEALEGRRDHFAGAAPVGVDYRRRIHVLASEGARRDGGGDVRRFVRDYRVARTWDGSGYIQSAMTTLWVLRISSHCAEEPMLMGPDMLNQMCVWLRRSWKMTG